MTIYKIASPFDERVINHFKPKTMKTTVKFCDIEFEVEYNYSPEEPMVMYYPDGSGYLGAPEEVEIYEIKYKGADFYEILSGELEHFENEILEQINEAKNPY